MLCLCLGRQVDEELYRGLAGRARELRLQYSQVQLRELKLALADLRELCVGAAA